MLVVQHISKSYEGKQVLRDISFQVETGETVCLLGASGSGKSTLLRIVAGLEPADSGRISFDGRDLTSTPAHLRDFGLVFQDYALFPHLNVSENVGFGLKMRRLPDSQIAERVVNALDLVNLSGFGNRQVTELSGGEQQRVALARALAVRPRLLLFDEPLGALDRTLREDLLGELRAILHTTSIPAIYVTHDQEEAFAVGDRILILHNAEIIREGTPADVWADPRSPFVASFLGLGNVAEGEVRGKANGRWEVESALGSFSIECEHEHQTGDKVRILARPLEDGAEHRDAEEKDTGGDVNLLSGVVSDVLFQQGKYKVTLDKGIQVYLQDPPGMGDRLEVPVRVECLA